MFLSVHYFINAQVTDFKASIKLADSLFERNKLWEASVYYERCLFDLENSSSSDKNDDKTIDFTSCLIKSIKGKICCLKTGGNTKDLPEFIVRCRQMDIPDSFRQTLAYDEMLGLYLNGSYIMAIELAKTLDSTVFSKEEISVGKLIILLSLNELNRWNEAEKAYLQYFKTLNSVNTEVASDSLSILFKRLPKLLKEKKRQNLAKLLPGLGQVYAGKPFEGLVNFCLQAGSIFFIVSTWGSGYFLASTLVGGSTLAAFRSGGERRTKKLIEIQNKRTIFKYKQKVKEQLLIL